MRRLIVLAALLLGAAAPATDWRQTVGVAPGGAFTVGNPAARVKLVEYLSFTCPHCGHFVLETAAPLHDAMVRNGSVQVETRSAARDPFDLAAWIVARCGGARRFHGLSTAIFAGQEAWMAKGQSYVQANLTALKAMPQLRQVATIADQSGLSAIAAKQGVTRPMLAKCFATDAQMKPVLAMTQAAFQRIGGTPAFEINGTLVDGFDWATLEPKLRAAGAQ